MQGKISMATVRQFMPLFFAELRRDGQIDRAMAAARGRVRDRPDWWMPVLFMRLRDGQLFDKLPPELSHMSVQSDCFFVSVAELFPHYIPMRAVILFYSVCARLRVGSVCCCVVVVVVSLLPG